MADSTCCRISLAAAAQCIALGCCGLLLLTQSFANGTCCGIYPLLDFDCRVVQSIPLRRSRLFSLPCGFLNGPRSFFRACRNLRLRLFRLRFQFCRGLFSLVTERPDRLGHVFQLLSRARCAAPRLLGTISRSVHGSAVRAAAQAISAIHFAAPRPRPHGPRGIVRRLPRAAVRSPASLHSRSPSGPPQTFAPTARTRAAAPPIPPAKPLPVSLLESAAWRPPRAAPLAARVARKHPWCSPGKGTPSRCPRSSLEVRRVPQRHHNFSL